VRVCLVEPGPVDTDFFDAVRALANQEASYGTEPPPDQLYNPMRDKPPRIMTAKLEDAARRVAALVEHPRRRLSFLRRTVWPWRLIGGLFQVAPAVGDLALSGMARRIDRERQA
jgi:hypothetical protein